MCLSIRLTHARAETFFPLIFTFSPHFGHTASAHHVACAARLLTQRVGDVLQYSHLKRWFAPILGELSNAQYPVHGIWCTVFKKNLGVFLPSKP